MIPLTDADTSKQQSIQKTEIIDVTSHLPQKPQASYWLRDLQLTCQDRQQLSSGEWLTDKHIRAASNLLKSQYPQQNGLQDTLVLATQLTWNSTPLEFIQIINVSGQHWVCTSNIGCPENVIDVYDSIPSYSVGSSTLARQLAAIIHTQRPTFELRCVNVQYQSGGNDCGLFAVANATALCNGQDPHSVGYNQSEMRQHLYESFEKQHMTPFPAGKKPPRMGRRRVSQVRQVKIYCSCRLPQSGDMIKCSICGEWYHAKCKPDIPTTYWNTTKKWSCSQCQN